MSMCIKEKFNKIHNYKYDYSMVKYLNVYTKIKIICKNHGIFEQTPKNHLSGQGCSYCSGKKTHPDDFIKKSNKIHNYKYDYSMAKYENNKSKLSIICPIHGKFEQLASSHLTGRGCPICFNDKCRQTKEEFIVKSRLKHGKKYDYSEVNYKNNRTSVDIICPHHGKFKQLPQHHQNGCGCPSCSNYGFDIDKEAILYYINIKNTNYYKIGITNNSIKERFKGDYNLIKVIDYIRLKGKQALNIEKVIKSKFEKKLYKGSFLLKNGNTEIFNEDIIESNLKKFIENEVY